MRIEFKTCLNGEFISLKSPYVDNTKEDCILAIDGATSTTGFVIMSLSGKLCAYGHFTRDVYRESPVRFKIYLKNEIKNILFNYRNIVEVVYEEPVLRHIQAIDNLYMLHSMVREILIENEDCLNYIKYKEISNTKWKKYFLYPDKIPTSSERVKEKISNRFNELEIDLINKNKISQDTKDAYGMCYAYIKNKDIVEFSSKKKISKGFCVEKEFIGLHSAKLMEEDIKLMISRLAIPSKVVENGLSIINITNKKDLDKEIIYNMAEDDKLLLFIYPSSKLGELLLKYPIINELRKSYDFIGVLVWRKNRKRKKEYII